MWGITCALVALGAFVLVQGSAASARAEWVAGAPALPRMARAASADTLQAAAEDIIDGNLFRADRSSAEAAITAVPATIGVPTVSTKPRLVLRGMLGGPPWDVIVDGVPGHDGALVIRVGQTAAGLTVRALRRDTVIVRGFDTTWALTLGHR
jgi:hypothetical protein